MKQIEKLFDDGLWCVDRYMDSIKHRTVAAVNADLKLAEQWKRVANFYVFNSRDEAVAFLILRAKQNIQKAKEAQAAAEKRLKKIEKKFQPEQKGEGHGCNDIRTNQTPERRAGRNATRNILASGSGPSTGRTEHPETAGTGSATDGPGQRPADNQESEADTGPANQQQTDARRPK